MFGESENDRKSIATLIGSLCPDVDAKPVVQPQVLIKGTQPRKGASNAEQIADVVRAMSARSEVLCVFAHEDADDLEPSHQRIAAEIEAALRAAQVPCQVHAVVPAWELETWWFLFPEQVAAVRPSWTQPATRTSLGKIRDSKEALARALRPSGLKPNERKRFPQYRESDSILIAKAISESGQARAVAGHSASYDRFVQSVATCCAAR